MNKFLLLFLFVVLAAGFAAAEDIGLTAGLEFGIVDMNKPNDAEDVYPYLDVSVEYENSFLDDALDIYAGLTFDVGFTQEMNDEGDEVNPSSLSFDFSIGYNLGLGDASTLSFILGNENNIDFVSTEDNVLGIIKPGIKFNQNMGDNGDFYAQADVPIYYLYYGLEKDDTFAGLDLTVGWASAFGLGLEAGGHILFSPDDDTFNGFTGISFTASYENGPIYAELGAAIPVKNLDTGAPYSYFDTSAGMGVSITPMFSYTFEFGLSVYLSLTFDGIGVTDNDPGISPAIGVTYSF
ncbi:MAG: hypothetical protein FWF55_08390 [Treponema sp.]|nr:hypothetical protein [Treponema sp.]